MLGESKEHSSRTLFNFGLQAFASLATDAIIGQIKIKLLIFHPLT
jgi:hypothetical protein